MIAALAITAAATIAAGTLVGLFSYALTHLADWLDARIAAHFINIASMECDR